MPDPVVPPNTQSRPTETLSSLKSKRGVQKRHITNTEPKILNLLEKPKENRSALLDKKEFLQNIVAPRLAALNDEVQTALAMDFELKGVGMGLAREALEDYVTTELMKDDEATLVYREKICSLVKQIDQAVSVVDGAPSGTPKQGASGDGAGKTRTAVRLPKIDLPTFSGKYTEWMSFWSRFKSLVHDMDYDDTTKMTYLLDCLKGEALACVKNMPIEGKSYAACIEILKNRYHQVAYITDAHLKALLSLPSCTSVSVTSLRLMCDTVNVNIRALQNLGFDKSCYGPWCVTLILQRIPDELEVVVKRQMGPKWEFDCLMELLEKETTNLIGSSETRSTSDGLVKGRATAHGLGTAAEEEEQEAPAKGRQPSERYCVFCEGSHPSETCPVYKDVRDRQKILKVSLRCYQCLRTGHGKQWCRGKRCTKCGKGHHTSLCFKPGLSQKPGGSKGVGTTEGTTAVAASMTRRKQVQKVLLETATAELVNPVSSQRHEIRVLFDKGSNLSYLVNRVAKDMNLPVVGACDLEVSRFLDLKPTKRSCDVVRFGVKGQPGKTDSEVVVFLKALTVPSICPGVSYGDLDPTELYPHLQGLELAENFDGKCSFDLLIGSDNYYKIVSDEVVRCPSSPNDGPVATSSLLGWILCGPLGRSHPTGAIGDDGSSSGFGLSASASCMQEVEKTLKSFWELEAIGIKDDVGNDVMHSFLSRLRYSEENQRYVARLPFKGNGPDPDMSFNRGVAFRRFQSLERKFKRDPELFRQYDAVMQQQIRDGIIEMAQTEGLAYLPHHPVVRPERETTKVRVVYDGSARTNGKLSLNQCLHTGPSLLPLLFEILIRFRCHRIAVTGDIEKAFLMIDVDEEDREYLHFFWYKESSVVEYRFCRVVFGLSCSPFLLNGTIKRHLSKFLHKEPVSLKLWTDLYVDDLVSGTATRDEAIDLIDKSREIMKTAGMNLRKFTSSNSEVSAHIRECFPGADEPPQLMKILGLWWDRLDDTFRYDFAPIGDYISEQRIIDKRVVLSSIARVYDPPGLLSPVVVRGKIILQLLAKVGWEDPLPDGLRSAWEAFCEDLRRACEIRLPRCYLPTKQVVSFELHGFSDASTKAYACCVYLRMACDDGYLSTLVASKTRVAPLSSETMPRLELMGCDILARMLHSCVSALQSQIPDLPVFAWSDSKVVLAWIHNDDPSKLKVFVRNRVKAIRKLQCQWQYCNIANNPADIASRGMACETMQKSELWWQGPEFLKNNDWRNSETVSDGDADVRDEIQAGMILHTAGEALDLIAPETNIIDVVRFSNHRRLVRSLGYVFRFLEYVRPQGRRFERLKHLEGCTDRSLAISAEELGHAENFIIEAVQHEAFPEAFTSFETGSEIPEQLQSLNLELGSDGILRCKSRLENSVLNECAVAPILLPRGHHFSVLVVRRAHKDVMHGGIRSTLIQVRERFLILRGRRLVQNVIKKCTECRRLRGKPYPSPITPPLPSFRVDGSPPFTFTGVDFAGPLYVVDGGQVRKTYISLFTCSATRAVHVELVTSMNIPSFLQSLRRFVSRRGKPALIVSDNAKTYRAVASEWEKISEEFRELVSNDDEDHSLRNYLAKQGIAWSFIIERAPWWGGYWERMVQTVKRSLRAVLGKCQLDRQEMETVLTEVEAVVNSRPLMQTAEDDEPLTPAHLLIGRRLIAMPDPADAKRFLDGQYPDLARHLRFRNKLMAQFWRTWLKEYLSTLPHANKQKFNGVVFQPKIGDVVIVRGQLPRQMWRTGRVLECLPDRFGNVRAVRLKMPEQGTEPLNRSIRDVVPIECSGC